MTDYLYTTSSDIELRRNGNKLELYFCDSQVSQWEDDLGDVSDYADADDLIDEVQGAIDLVSNELAKSIVLNAIKKKMLLELDPGYEVES